MNAEAIDKLIAHLEQPVHFDMRWVSTHNDLGCQKNGEPVKYGCETACCILGHPEALNLHSFGAPLGEIEKALFYPDVFFAGDGEIFSFSCGTPGITRAHAISALKRVKQGYTTAADIWKDAIDELCRGLPQ